MPTCDLARRNCDRDATHAVTIIDNDDTFDNLERVCCDRHVGWYRNAYEERGYTVEFEPLPEADA